MNGIPWEDPEVGFPEDLGRTWIESLTAPVSFFRRLEPEAPLARAVLYFLIMAVGAALFSLLWGLAGSAPELPLPAADVLDLDPRGIQLFGFFLSPFANLILLGLASVSVHVFVRLLTDSSHQFLATTRVICYASGPALLTIVPWAGEIAGWIGSAILLTIGIREVHGTTTGRATLTVLFPVLLAVLLTGLAWVFVLAVFASLGDLPLA
ncbi:MAG: YIP1 family protein [Gemmatimonadetes bacterium]|nr:YIP1 family protein [Gemmatimonadota bacterium]